MNRLFTKKKTSGGANNTLWWMVQGLRYSDVIAVYQCKGAENQADALKDKTLNGYNLSPSSGVTWDAEHGLMSGYAENSALGVLSANKEIKTGIIRFSNYKHTANNEFLSYLRFGNILMLRSQFSYQQHDTSGAKTAAGAGEMAIFKSHGEGDSSSGHWNSLYWTRANRYAPSSGVLAYDRNWHMFLDGTALNYGQASCTGWSAVGGKPSTTNNRPLQMTNAYVIAAAFYSVVLSENAHKQIAQMMMTI